MFFSLISLFSCNNIKEKEIEKRLENISWRNAVKEEYMLVSPICYLDTKDAYQLPIQKGEWYLISVNSNCVLLPVRIYYDATIPDFVENVTKWKKIAVIDTVSIHESRLDRFEGLKSVETLAIICMADGYKIRPEMTSKRYYQVIAEKNN